MSSHSVAIDTIENRIRLQLRQHLELIGISEAKDGTVHPPETVKNAIRLCHLSQRREKFSRAGDFLRRQLPKLLPYFSSGKDIVPEKISPRIQLIEPGSREADLFRLASLTWSVPVSEGFGRRMRFIVWDDANGKLIGIIALGDPVFNLRVRDKVIGWTSEDRKERLVDVMDAYVLGAVPPYNMLLGGKLVACLVRTREIRDYFSARYRRTTGIISGKRKNANLVMVTTTSALGRSSVYNRLRFNGTPYFESIGYTIGYGHFHVSNQLFAELRRYLQARGHNYYANNRYGSGPNWKFRAIRAALELMGIKRDILCHGIQREVFVCRLAKNADEVLRGEKKRPSYTDLLSVKEVGGLVLDRWVCPRALRKPAFIAWDRDEIMKLLSV